MTGPRHRRLALVLAAALLAVTVPSILAYHGGTGHSLDLQVADVWVFEAGAFDPLAPPEDTEANRVDFLASGENDATVVVSLLNETTGDDGAREVSVYLEADPADDVTFQGPTCWNWNVTPDNADPDAIGWNATTTGINVTGDGSITLTAHINDDETEANCQYDAWTENADLTKGNNQGSRTVHGGSQPDLAAPGPDEADPVAWCWRAGHKPADGADHNTALCPDHIAVNASNPDVTRPYDTATANETYFRVLLENLGNYTQTDSNYGAGEEPSHAPVGEGNGTDGQFDGLADPDSTAALDHQVNVTITNLDRDQTWYRSRDAANRVDYLGNTSSLYFDLAGKPAGPYHVTVGIDEPQDRIEEQDEDNNTLARAFHLFGPDVTPTIDRSDIRTDPDDPYEYGDSVRTIEVDVAIDNVGNRTADGDWQWRAQLDPEHPDRRHRLNATTDVNRTFAPDLAPDAGETRTLEITYCQDTDADCYLPAGEHTLHVALDTDDDEADPWNALNEESESDNADQVTFFLNDTTAPSVVDRSPPPPEVVRVGQSVDFSAQIQEDDPSFDDVTLHLDEPGQDEVRTEEMAATEESQGGPTWNFTLTLADLDVEGDYTWWISGADPSGNTFSTAGDLLAFEVAEYPKRIDVESPPPPQDNLLEWDPNNPQDINFTATINGTGWEPLNSTTGKELNLTDPLGRTFDLDLKSNWTDAGCPDAQGCDEDDRDLFYRVRSFIHPDLLGSDPPIDPDMPGNWNATYAVQDKAGVWKEETIRFRLQDEEPEVSGSLTEVETPLDGGEVNSESEFTVTTNATDPDGCWYAGDGCQDDSAFVDSGLDHGMQAVHLNFTHRPTGETVNLTMTLTDGNETESNWTRTVTTGRDGDLRWAGGYNYSVEGRDIPRNWDVVPADHDSLETPRVHVFDTRQPSIEDAGVTPTEEETNVNVTFFAEVDDDTATTVRVSLEEIPDASTICGDQDQCSLDLRQRGDTDRYERKVSFDAAGEYDFSVIATDSAGNDASSSSETLTISQNRPPQVEVVRPEAAADASNTYYTDARPDLFLSITDPSGIEESSIELTVDGNDINQSAFDTLNQIPSPPARKPGYNFSYTLGSQYNDSAEIPVTVSARDTSAQGKLASVSYTFIVDDAAPNAEFPPDKPFKPRYRAGGAIWNVSPHTEFILEGSDPGEKASGVADIIYQIEKETAGSPITYTGPFKINESTPGWSGPGLYNITYWAVDRVGNDGLLRTRSVQLDRAGPEITYLPKGPFVNASISDPQGVAEATLHHKPLDAETFENTTMAFEDGLYRATLPTGDLTIGDRLEYFISAQDTLENRRLKFSEDGDPYVYEAGNRPPEVSWLSPGDGDTVEGTVTFRWEGSDPDPDQEVGYGLEFKLASEDDSAYEGLTAVDGSQVTYDTSQLPDGVYDLRVVASDGFSDSTDVIQVRFENTDAVATPNELTNTRFRLGEPITFTTQVGQAAESVTLVVTRDGETVAEVPMRDDGEPPDAEAGDNIYSTEAQFDESGTYSWHVAVSYQEDGQVVTDRSDEGQSFQVETTASQVFEQNLGLWVAIAILTAAALGIGAYALRNHQQGP